MTTFNNLAQDTREALMDSLQKQASDDTGTYVNVSGDVMTGNLEVPTVVVSGAATVAGPTRFTNLVTAGTVVATGAVTLAGPTRFVNTVTAGGLALTSLASLVGSWNTTGVINSTGTLNMTGIINVNSNASAANPVIIGFGSVLGGPTIAPIQIIASGASQSMLDFRGALISTASINIAANKTIGFIPVQLNASSGFIPVFIGIGS